MKKIIAAVLAAVLALTLAGIGAWAEEGSAPDYQLIRDEEPAVSIDLEAAEENEDFVTNLEMADYNHLGISFINPASHTQFTSKDAIADGIMLKIDDFCDIRVWSLSVTGKDGYALDMTVNVESLSGGGYFQLCVTDAEIPESHNESEGGFVWVLQPDDSGALVMYNHSRQQVTTLEFGKTYTITFYVEDGESDYMLFINDAFVGKDSFLGEVTNISAFRFDQRGEGIVNVDDIILDGAYARKKAAATPTPAPTEVPTEAPTEAPTDAPTDAPADAATDAPASAEAPATKDAGSENEAKKDGKNPLPAILIAVGAVIVIGAAAAVIIAKKKKG